MGMTASMAGRYAGHKISQQFRDREARQAAREAYHRNAGEQLSETLGELKGAAMKLGQFASQVSDMLPAELAEPLKRLQKDAPPMPFAVIRQQIENELQAELGSLFASLDETPYAAASIGQVHHGSLHDGREIVIKVQYPGVAASCDSDLNQLRRALRAARLFKVDDQVLDQIFEEIRDRLHEELDYCQEADNLRQAQSLFKGMPGLVLPEVIDSHSTESILCMTYVPGQTLESVSSTDQADKIASKIYDFMIQGLFEHNFVHADPNPANFAINESGDLIVYDFGCVKQVSDAVLEAYKNALQSGIDEDWDALDHALLRLGARVPGSPRMPDDFYAQWRPIVLAPFLQAGAFDFGQSDLHQQAMAKTPDVMRYMDRLQPQAQTLFIDRVISGHYWNLVKLSARIDLTPALKPYLNGL